MAGLGRIIIDADIGNHRTKHRRPHAPRQRLRAPGNVNHFGAYVVWHVGPLIPGRGGILRGRLRRAYVSIRVRGRGGTSDEQIFFMTGGRSERTIVLCVVIGI